MDFEGSYLLLADRQAVWRALNDASILKEVIPGCSRIVWTSSTTLDLEIKVNLGVAHPKFGGELELTDIDPAIAYTLNGKGRGGILGLAHGAARITLGDFDLSNLPVDLDHLDGAGQVGEPWPRYGLGTVLHFNAEGGASGQIMALGKSLVGKSAQRIIDRFFVAFATAMDTSVRAMPTEENPANMHHQL